MPGDDAFTPASMRQASARELAVRWLDGHESVYEVRRLRLACACAQCVDEWSGEESLDAASVPADVRPLEIRPVGRYAIQIDWSDGHASGIYPFRRLRALCPCGSCAGAQTSPERSESDGDRTAKLGEPRAR